MDPEVREMLRAATPKAAQRLVEALDAERPIVVGNGAHAAVELHPDCDMRVRAANAILDRLYGKPTQAISGEDKDEIPIGPSDALLEVFKKLAGV
jgi:hypothetical protein